MKKLPPNGKTQQQLTKSLEELRAGVAAAKRLLLERCEIREDEDSQPDLIRAPLSGKARAAGGTVNENA
jgi:hypothetical protein